MSPTLTLPQLLERFRDVTASKATGEPEVLHTYHSIGVEGCSLTLADVQSLLQTGSKLTGKLQSDQLMIIDHQNAYKQILGMANQREPLNRNAIQEVASTLMRHTGGPIHSLLSQYDTSQGELRIDTNSVGRRVLIDAHKLPRALDQLLKEINTAITRLKTPRQIYDLSFEAHFQLLTLHPFGAGNGPMARFLMNYIQQFHQQPLSLVHVDSRIPYDRSLEASWLQKTPIPIVSFMHNQLVRFLQECIE
ncbi:hypothetical protein BH09BAC4_BH09BAC4_19250 [soil metagenome]